MSIKHTPGPWVIDSDGDGKANAIVTSTHTASLDDDICEVYGGNKDDDDIRKANARLIAAAPELLEAIREVVGFFDCAVEINALQKMALLLAHFDDNLEEIKRLQTAIAEEEGEDK